MQGKQHPENVKIRKYFAIIKDCVLWVEKKLGNIAWIIYVCVNRAGLMGPLVRQIARKAIHIFTLASALFHYDKIKCFYERYISYMEE